MGFKNYAWAAGLYVVINAALYSTEYSKGGKIVKRGPASGGLGRPGAIPHRAFSEQYKRGGSQEGYGQMETYD